MAFLKKLFKGKKEPVKKAVLVSDVKEKDDVVKKGEEKVADKVPPLRPASSGRDDKQEKKVSAAKKTSKKKVYSAHKILLRPLITEKATDLAQFNKYAFAVAKDATKIQVAEAVRSTYGVAPVKVNVVRFQGKKIRHGRRIGQTKSWKKAIVTLRSEDRIEIYEGV